MTKKDYIKIAEVFKNRYNEAINMRIDADELFYDLETEMAIMLKKDNPKFNNQRFVDYINN